MVPKTERTTALDNNLGYLFAAFAIVWLVMGSYLIYLGQQVRALRDETRVLDEEIDAPH